MISGIIMAAGFSNRMGQDKLLLEIKGKKIIEYVIEAAKKSDLDEVILVYRKKELREIGRNYGIRTVYNPRADLGQSQSVILGVENSRNKNYMFLVGDQPFTNYKLLNKLIKKFRRNRDKIIIPYYKGKVNMPLIFPGIFKRDLLKVEGDKGGREIIRGNPDSIVGLDIKDKYLVTDIDTRDEYENLVGKKLSKKL